MSKAGEKAPYDATALHRKYLEERDKRLRQDAEAQFIEATGEFEEFAEDPYVKSPLERNPVEEDIDVAVIGGGFGGLLTASELRKRGVDSFRIIEQGADFGGTWYWNRYPGVRCDIESFIYMPLLEEVGTIPSEHYASGAEIFAHCQAIGRHFALYDHALFQTRVLRMAWDNDLCRWLIHTSRGDQLRARFVTVSQGPLAKVKLPGIPGIKSFKGRMFHSSRWDYDYTGGDSKGSLTGLETERVAVIGTGATAVQIVPQLAKYAKALFLFQRTPPAIDMRGNQPTDTTWFEKLPAGWQRERMNNFLSIISGRPQSHDMVNDRWTDFWKRLGGLMQQKHTAGESPDPHEVMQVVDYQKMEELRGRVAELVEDSSVAEALKPWYNYLCKRPLYSDDFLQAFNLPNVTLVDTDGRGVERITETAIIANGCEYEVDCIIFATGFDVGAAAHKVGGYELTGRDGISIDEKWVDGVRSVHGTQINGFPNFHIVGGVTQGTTAFNFTHILSMQAHHAVDLVARCLHEGIMLMEVTREAEQNWLKKMEEKHIDRTHFYEECTPGFLNNEGDFKNKPTFIGSTYGGGPIEYQEILERWREEQVGADCELIYANIAERARRSA